MYNNYMYSAMLNWSYKYSLPAAYVAPEKRLSWLPEAKKPYPAPPTLLLVTQSRDPKPWTHPKDQGLHYDPSNKN